MNGFQDIELLSAYQDGQLSPSDSARLESRLASDPELASVFNDLRIARNILRNLPARKAPRNFTLTRKMVGAKPPMPRAYSFLRFSSAFATVLLIITFAVNIFTPRMSFGAAAPAQEFGYGGGFGMGGGGGCAEPCGLDATQAQAPAAAEAPAIEGMPPASGEATPSSLANVREMETPTPGLAALPKEGATASAPQTQPQVQNEASVVSSAWQIGLFLIGLLSAGIVFVMRQSAKRKWS